MRAFDIKQKNTKNLWNERVEALCRRYSFSCYSFCTESGHFLCILHIHLISGRTTFMKQVNIFHDENENCFFVWKCAMWLFILWRMLMNVELFNWLEIADVNAKLKLNKTCLCRSSIYRCFYCITEIDPRGKTYLSYKQAESNWDCDNAKLYRPSDGESTNL